MVSYDFSDIEAYQDEQLKEVIPRLLANEAIQRLVQKVMPEWNLNEMMPLFEEISTIDAFQEKVVVQIVHKILETTSNGTTISGMENIKPDGSYLFISNHRDIVLDSAVLNRLLLENGFKTVKIATGDNLLKADWIEDLVRINKSFLVNRNLPKREMLLASQRLSAYIGKQIVEKIDSVWIAQKQGRAKDGNDKTHTGLLKMLILHDRAEWLEHLKRLHIVPIAISYELEPCDLSKAQERYVRAAGEGAYEKDAQEDLRSIRTGMLDPKGKIHIGVGQELGPFLDTLSEVSPRDTQIRALQQEIDRQIYKNFKLWPNNYIAYDLLNETDEWAANYTPQERQRFVAYVQEKLDDGHPEMRDYLLEIYANPVRNLFSERPIIS